MAEFFGWKLEKAIQDKPQQQQANNISFVPKDPDDGSILVAAGGAYGTYVDIEGAVRNDSELITRYRLMSEHPELDTAITAIVNEAIINEPNTDTLSINLDTCDDIPEGTKTKIEEEFKNILALFNFNHDGYEMFRRWYIDGRLFYHAIFDPSNPGKGIQELRYIDPRKIRKVKELQPIVTDGGKSNAVSGGQVTLIRTHLEYYVFNDNGFSGRDISSLPTASQAMAGIKIAKDNILQVTSGLMDPQTGKITISYLNKAIKPLNMLTMMEDSLVIYRVARAPERRVFYVDTTGMPRPKAEQYLQQLMVRFKNKLAYDSATGEIRDERKFSTMLEDFWLPRRDGGKGTEITTLPGGQNLGEIEDVMYMLKKLFKALSIPVSRIDPEALFSIGRATEISRDEVSFEKFITRLRSRFSYILLGALRLQLLTKKIINGDDWQKIKNHIGFKYAEDNLFAELKANEMMTARLEIVNMMLPLVGRFFSNEQVRSEVLKQTEEEQKNIDKQIKEEQDIEQYQLPDESGVMGAEGASTGFDPQGPMIDGGDVTPQNGQEPPRQLK